MGRLLWIIQLMEEGMATPPVGWSGLEVSWGIPWTEETGGLQSIRLQRVGHDSSDLAGMLPAESNIITSILIKGRERQAKEQERQCCDENSTLLSLQMKEWGPEPRNVDSLL